jgi:hypothetical protein
LAWTKAPTPIFPMKYINAGVKETVSRDYLICFVLKTKNQ